MRGGSNPLRGIKKGFGGRRLWGWSAVGCAVIALLFAVGVATGKVAGINSADDAGSPSFHGAPNSPLSVSTHDRVLSHEALPCTGPTDPINFEAFSAGPAPTGLSLTGTSRRCDPASSGGRWPNNYVNYSYGACRIPKGATGCSPPLTIQTWPACQRSMSDYSFEGKPLPHRKLPPWGGAEVVEFTFPANRVEVYTKATTIVIFAASPELARKAVRLLRPQEKGTPPARNADDLSGARPEGLAPPSKGSMEGVLECQS